MAFSSAHVFLIILAAERGIEQVIPGETKSVLRNSEARNTARHLRGSFSAFMCAGFFPSAWKRPQRMQRSSYLRHRPFWCFCFFKPGVIGASLSLGRFWNTKIIAVPGAELVRAGPYLFFKHPNYAVVSLEIFIYPAIFGCWITALVFGLSNIFVLKKRIRQEEAALGI